MAGSPPRERAARAGEEGYPGKCTAKASATGRVPETAPSLMVDGGSSGGGAAAGAGEEGSVIERARSEEGLCVFHVLRACWDVRARRIQKD